MHTSKKRIIEIFKDVKCTIEEDESFLGICFTIHTSQWLDSDITMQELEDLFDVLIDNKPSTCGDLYWWKKGLKQPRIEFLDKLIKKLEK